MTIGSSVECETNKPRVISELKKSSVNKRRLCSSNSLYHDARPKISGELLWSATPTQWHVKTAEVRHGCLIVHCSSSGVPEFRLPLHHLNIHAARTPRTFTLSTGHGIALATFQTLTEEEYRRWVRVLAVEVLRQTPLQDVRLLDIIGITRKEEALRRGRSEECLASAPCSETQGVAEIDIFKRNHRNKQNFKDEYKKCKERVEFSQWLHCVKRETEEETNNKSMDFDMKNMKIRRAQRIRPKLPFAETWTKLHGSAISSDNNLIARHQKISVSRSVSMEDLPKRVQLGPLESLKCTRIEENKKVVSDESGISSGDENNNIISDSLLQPEEMAMPESLYVSVREKKQFFESLSGENEGKRSQLSLNRSNSIGTIDRVKKQPRLRRSDRASSMHDLTGNTLPVKEMRRLFEGGLANDMSRSFDELRFDDRSTIIEEEETPYGEIYEDVQLPKTSEFVNPVERKPKETVNYANIQVFKREDTPKTVRFCENKVQNLKEMEKDKVPRNTTEYANIKICETVNVVNGCTIKETKDEPKVSIEDGSKEKDMSTLLIQRKLQRGERKLGKLRIQIAEVEETIKIIAEDLHSIGPETLQRRSGLEVFAALRRRLEEESSRLERLQEETAKVINDNQRTIVKLNRK